MPRCDLESHPRACVITQSKYKRPECRGCATGEKHLRAVEGAASPVPVKNIPEIIPAAPDPIQPEKKETPVATDKKDLILKRIENEKRCTKSRLMNFCGATADQVAEATKVLEAEGKIKSHPGIREGSVIYTLPGIPKDYEGEPISPAKKKTPATPPIKKSAKAELPVSAPRKSSGNGVYAAAIADLEARRTAALDQVEKIDTALAGLRALA